VPAKRHAQGAHHLVAALTVEATDFMDFSKLSSNEKLAVYGSVAAIIGGLVGGLSGLIWLSILAAIGMLAVVFLPMMSPNTTLPGSKGSLLVVLGGIAGVAAVLGLLTIIADIGSWFEVSAVRTIFFLIAVAGSLVMAWIGWQEFQAEGGKFNLGTASSAPPAPAPPAAPPAPPAPPMAEPMAPPASGSMDEPMSDQMSEPMRPMGGESNPEDEPPA
jgi:hypothetical protein